MRILVVDDDIDSLDAVSEFLSDSLQNDVEKATHCDAALKMYRAAPFPIVISDIKMQGMNGIELLKEIKSLPSGAETDVVLMTGFGELETCIQALRYGASDYILKPVYIHHLDKIIRRITEKQELKKTLHTLNNKYNEKLEQNRSITARLEQYKSICSNLIEGEEMGVFSDQMRDLVDLSLKLHEDRDLPVLIEGETGTGKEVVARLIHRGRNTVSSPFVTINCSAISPSLFESELFGYERGAFTGARGEGMTGKLELAQDGSIFLDEIGDMPLEMQPKLLRAIQQKEIYRIGGNRPVRLNIRFICATNQPLAQMVREKKFRQDLYYRIHSGHVQIPPLRKRIAEIAPLARMFLNGIRKTKNRKMKYLDRDAVFKMEQYKWPGNIRELKNTIERIALLHDSEILKPEFLNFLETSIAADTDQHLILDLSGNQYPLKEIKFRIAERILKKYDGNISKAAKYLDVAWATFVKMARLNP